MPTIWFAKDGPRPDSQAGSGMQINNQEAQVIVAKRQAMFVGTEAPSINPETPSYSQRNVVLEVESGEEVCSSLPKVGFYLVAGLSPSEAQRMLTEYRGRA